MASLKVSRPPIGEFRIQIGNTFFGSTSSFASGFFGSEVVDVSGAVFSSGSGPNALVTVSAPIVIGTPFTIGAEFQTNAFAVIDAGDVSPLTQGLTLASGESIYTNTATWNGIQSITVGNQVFTDFEVTSPSGINYAVPVPEPGTALLVGTGLAISAIPLRRRKAA